MNNQTVFILLIAVFAMEKIVEFVLTGMNLKYTLKKGNTIPPEFEGLLDEDKLRKTQDYSTAKTRFGVVTDILSIALMSLVLFGGGLELYNNWVLTWGLPGIWKNILFFIVAIVGITIAEIPVLIYSTFNIEKRFGFNKTTAGTFITDLLKSLLLQTALITGVLFVGFKLIAASPDFWWLWFWLFYFVFSLFIMYISPYVIQPLFNKFTPLEDGELKDKIKALMEKVGIRLDNIFVMDASKRSGHSNAYFTGIGKVKRIVFYDTLLKQMDEDEILAILSHEAGHWKKKHLIKRIISSEIISLGIFYIAYLLLKSDWLTNVFNLSEKSLPAQLVLIGFVFSLVSALFTPLSAHFSRKHERQADGYSLKLMGNGKAMISALTKLSVENLSNLYPHPLYSKIYYSHPPVLERVDFLKKGEPLNQK